MRCVLCRWLRRSTGRHNPVWLEEADKFEASALLRSMNTDALFKSDPDAARLREIFGLWRSDPVEAFGQFLTLAEGGSVFSMIKVGYAYETGRGAPRDLIRAEQWYVKAHEQGSDYGLVRASGLLFKRGDVATAKSLLAVGVARGLPQAMTYLAWMELKLSRGKDAQSRARAHYEQAIALGDLPAKMRFARAMARGRFCFRAIPAGIRSVLA